MLGAISGLGETPDADSLFTPDILNQIPVTTTTSSTEDLNTYASRILFIESSYDVLTLLANMNSTDKSSIASAREQATNIVASMRQVPVPETLVTYHRYKMMYYSALINMGDIWLGDRPETDLQSQSTMLFSMMAKIESIKSSISKQYGIAL